MHSGSCIKTTLSNKWNQRRCRFFVCRLQHFSVLRVYTKKYRDIYHVAVRYYRYIIINYYL